MATKQLLHGDAATNYQHVLGVKGVKEVAEVNVINEVKEVKVPPAPEATVEEVKGRYLGMQCLISLDFSGKIYCPFSAH